MIESLRIRELALVEDLEVTFEPGLNVLTGETGAGKSVVLGALGLLAGARARTDDLREGAEEGSVEAVLRTDGEAGLLADLAERGLEAEDGTLIVRRTLSRGGRGRAWVGGRLVPVGTLAELLAGRIEVSSQHASQALLRPAAQGRALDAHGGLLSLRGEVERGVRELLAREDEIARLRADAEERARREDFLAFQVQEIDAAGLDPEESASLDAEHRRLVHADRLRADTSAAAAQLLGDPASPEQAGAADLVGRAARAAGELAELDPGLAELGERLSSAATEISEAASDLERYAAGIDLDAGRLAQVEERLAAIERLSRKYGKGAVEILAFRDEAARELAAISGSDERLAKLEAERAAEHGRVAELAARLSAGRKKAARALGRAVTRELRQLALDDAVLEVVLEPQPAPEGAPCAGSGAETAALHFTANAGEPARSLKHVASGGELSRVFLALKNVLRRAGEGSVLLFDEVDAGIGGAVADRVGAVLAALASDHQVLCITHLPGIAAQPAHHLQVSKQTRRGRTRTDVVALDDEGRVAEIARMAGGDARGEGTLAHARELLGRGAEPSSKSKQKARGKAPRRRR